MNREREKTKSRLLFEMFMNLFESGEKHDEDFTAMQTLRKEWQFVHFENLKNDQKQVIWLTPSGYYMETYERRGELTRLERL